MSLRTLPLLVLNLGGEMLYIVDQRLRAQSIPGDKARQVMNDIIGGIFNKKFMDELFKPQELYSRKALRTVFERLVHASIMRLNAPSMDKLYDLMTMAFKYQVLLCPRPKDLLLITFNHLDTIKEFIYESPKTLTQVDVTFRRLIDTYGSLSAGEFQLIRQTLLIFFQDIHIRVSILLKDKVQNSNGHFVLPTSGPVPWGTDVPGVIRLFNRRGDEIKRTEFTHGGNYVLPYREGSFELHGDRVIKLGTNIYSISRPVETDTSGAAKNLASRVKENTAPNPLAKEELNLLARLMGGLEVKKPTEAGFRLNLFTTDEEEEHAALTRPEELTYQVININAEQGAIDGAEPLGEGADDLGEQPGGAAAGPAGPGDHRGAAGRGGGGGPRGQRGRLHEHPPGRGRFHRPGRAPVPTGRPLRLRAQRPLRPHPGRGGHPGRHRGPAPAHPPRPDLRGRRPGAQGVPAPTEGRGARVRNGGTLRPPPLQKRLGT